MAWSTSRRHARLPRNWHTIQPFILGRDPMCQLRLEGCTHISTEVDHAGNDDDHHLHMLRGVCHECHVKRTAQQSAAGRGLKARRPTEAHPNRT